MESKLKITFGHVEKGIYNNLVMYLNGIKIGDSEWVDHNYNASEIVEYTTYESYNTFKENDSLAYIEYFHIESDFRGKGYSKKLIRKTLSLIREKKCNRHISLIVHPETGSKVNTKILLKLYRSFGFKSQYNCREHWMHIYKIRGKKNRNRIKM